MKRKRLDNYYFTKIFGIVIGGGMVILGNIGCSNMSNTAQGGLLGGGLGAGVGAALGSITGNAGAGAAIGAVGGGLLGGVVGNDIDQEKKKEKELQLAAANDRAAIAESQNSQPKLGITDVMNLVRAGTSDQVIINQIRTTGSTFQLSTADIEMLKSNGVSDSIIIAMQNAQPKVYVQRPTVIRERPAVIYTSPPPVIVERGFYPGPVFVGGGYYRRW